MSAGRRAGLVLLVLLATACAPAAAPPGSGPAAQPAGASAPATATGQAPASAPATVAAPAPASAASAPAAPAGGGAARGDAAAWERAKAAARQEGRVVVAGPPFPGLRNSLSEGFQRAYGVAVEYVTLPGGELMTRVDREAKAGTTSLDISIAGNVSCWTMGERGQLDNAREVVIDPGLYEPAVWRTGQPKFLAASPVMPPDFACGLQTAEWVMTDLFVNRDLIPPGTIQSWRDLLKPEYKGKIASFDPRRAGPAHTTVPYIYSQFGLDYLRDLYVGQDPALTTDNRQLAEWVARGTHPIGIALVQGAAEPFRAEGLPLERIFPADGPGSVTGGFSLIEKLKGGPNPNAGLVFLNWFASKDAQELYEREVMEMSLRADVSHQVPDYVMPKGGVSYLDSYDPTYYYPQMEGVDKLVALMGR